MEKNKLNILNKFFSRNTFRHCYEDGYDKVYGQVIRRYVDNGVGKTNLELVSEVYNVLKDEYRNEYYYKNTLLNKLLLGVHSINTTTALTEIPIAKSKADFVLINGKAVVYEIKTELDNFDRLESQISDYYKAFDHVAVVTCIENVPVLQKKIEVIGKPVGIYVLQKRGTIKTIQKPEIYRDSLDTSILFKILRKQEYEEIVLKKYGYLPVVSAFEYYSECKKMFLEIPLEEAYLSVLKLLKKRAKIVKEDYKKYLMN
ncbi:sce7726 family protein [[Ruminococcus] torques]|nr:sce7726 family protein [[Ruminococcus] torques]